MKAITNTPEVLLARYGELWLKGKNRGDFERRLTRNVRRAVRAIEPDTEIQRAHGMLMLRPPRRIVEVTRRLREVFGLSSISPAWGAPLDVEAIADVALHTVTEALASRPAGEKLRFRVQTRRSDKRFPMKSTEVDRFVGDRVMRVHGDRLRVHLDDPELVCGIGIRARRAYVFTERLTGSGGLPVGSTGRVVALFSGGIDSPVAAWMAMKRGLDVIYCAFHSYPYVGEGFRRKVERLARRVSRFQNGGLIYALPLTEVQKAIRDGAPEGYRTVLYRRAMQRLAERVARAEKAQALITGESVGQVASQTLENIECIARAADFPVLRPLIAYDKAETIAVAKRIGTYDISIEPEPDCCTLFQPRRPVLQARAGVCEEVEAKLPMNELLDASFEHAERTILREDGTRTALRPSGQPG